MSRVMQISGDDVAFVVTRPNDNRFINNNNDKTSTPQLAAQCQC